MCVENTLNALSGLTRWFNQLTINHKDDKFTITVRLSDKHLYEMTGRSLKDVTLKLKHEIFGKPVPPKSRRRKINAR